MRVFMLGWEFPPFISGGLGTACQGLTRALGSIGTDVLFVLPRPLQQSPAPTAIERPSHASPSAELLTDAVIEEVSTSPAVVHDKNLQHPTRLDGLDNVRFRSVAAQIHDPYQSASDFADQHRSSAATTSVEHSTSESSWNTGSLNLVLPRWAQSGKKTTSPQVLKAPARDQYSGDLYSEVERFANLASDIGREENFDIVHAHDWMTFPAGMAVAATKGVPLVVHVHSTEFDRSGTRIDPRIFEIERRGMRAAMKIIAVSYLTRNQITHHYGIHPDKIAVVYNAIEAPPRTFDPEKYKIHHDEKIVLFLGRITQQKGPEYFLAAAKKVLEVMDNVKFVMAGSGDMIRQTIDMASNMGIGHKILFTGFLRGPDVERIFRLADLYVMPSVSEPFGIAPLEAMSNDVPVLISKQSGVSEVLSHVLKVDFWDTNEMANKIVAVLKHPPLANTLRQHGNIEVRQMSWLDAAHACEVIYEQAVSMVKPDVPSAVNEG